MEQRKLNKSELALFSDFLTSLKTENVNLFWDCLSNRCKFLIETEAEDFKGKNKEEVLKLFKNKIGYELDSLGIANLIQFTNQEKTKGMGFLQSNVKTNIYYIQDTQIRGIEVPLEYENGEFKINILKKV